MIKVEDYFVNELKQSCIVLELATSGSLESHIQARMASKTPFTEEEVLKIYANLVLGLYELHS